MTMAGRVARAFLDATTTGEAIDEVRAEQPLERVAGRDRHGARYRARGAEVHQKRTHHDGRPDVVPDEQQGGERDPRRRPHGRRVGVEDGEPQPHPARHEVRGGEDHEQSHASERLRLDGPSQPVSPDWGARRRDVTI